MKFHNRAKWIGSGAQFVGGSLLLVSDEYGQVGGSVALGGFALEKFSEWRKENLEIQARKIEQEYSELQARQLHHEHRD